MHNFLYIDKRITFGCQLSEKRYISEGGGEQNRYNLAVLPRYVTPIPS